MTKQIVNVITSFKLLLKVIEPYVKNFELMLKEKTFPGSSLRPLEVWGNWLMCAVVRKNISGAITFADDSEGDGIILDRRDGSTRQTEHVSATDNPFSHEKLPLGEKRIIDAINMKIEKRYSDAKDKALIVFFDGAGEWYRPKIREAINGRHNFHKIFLIGLLTKDEKGFAYSVTQLMRDDSMTFKVQIDPDFTHWSVTKMQ